MKHFLGHMLANDIWQKEEILAAKLENFLTTVLNHVSIVLHVQSISFSLLLLLVVFLIRSMSFFHILFCLVNNLEDDVLSSLPVSHSKMKSSIFFKEFQSHSLEEKDLGHETTLKDSGIDTASSSTILNIHTNDALKKVVCLSSLCLSLSSSNREKQRIYLFVCALLANNNLAME